MNLNDISSSERKAAAGAFRYEIQRTAQGLLWDKKVEGWKGQHRTCWCSRSLNRGSETVDVYRNENRDGASLAGMNRCGNVWTCPVCAAKIAEPRRAELQAGMVNHIENGGSAYLFNFTFPHTADEPLSELMEKFGKVRQAFQNSREWGAFKKYAGNIEFRRSIKGEKKQVVDIGVVNSLEFTVSEKNGWHPHLHMLVFCKRKGLGDDEHIDEDGNIYSHILGTLQKKWVSLLLKFGLGEQSKSNDMMKYALVVRGGEKAAEYIAKFGRDEKWGASSELARSHAKIGAAGKIDSIQHFTPFQLLVWAADRDKWAIRKFIEYAEAVEGKRALVWAPGLKDALGIDEIDDEQLAEERPMQIMVGTITSEQFSIITRKKALPMFLQYVAGSANDQIDLDEYIDSLRTIPDTGSGAVLVKKFMGSGMSMIYA